MHRLIAFALLGSLVIVTCAPGRVAVDPSAQGSGSAPASPPSDAALIARLDALVAEFPGEAGIWVGDPSSTATLYAHQADEQVAAASLYKLAILMEAERRIDAGTLRNDQLITIQPEDLTGEGSVYELGADVPMDEALEAMITVSDNPTALALWRLLGADAIDMTLDRAGMRDFQVDLLGSTVATPRAIGTFFTLLAKKQLVSAAASERMLGRLERQTINDRLPATLPVGIKVAHKTGDLPGLVHDAGVIFTPAGPRVVVVMTWDADDDVARTLIGDVGAAVYRATEHP